MPMPTVTFITADGARHEVTAAEGATLMETARRAGIDGIAAECGGACACATCHVQIEPEWFTATGAPGPDEFEMLDFASERGPTSRLSCQIRVTAALDGLVVRVPG